MIYTDEQLIDKIKDMIEKFEDEVVEFKEARSEEHTSELQSPS